MCFFFFFLGRGRFLFVKYFVCLLGVSLDVFFFVFLSLFWCLWLFYFCFPDFLFWCFFLFVFFVFLVLCFLFVCFACVFVVFFSAWFFSSPGFMGCFVYFV